jgi:D-alanyl-D-alanine dipeptidase
MMIIKGFFGSKLPLLVLFLGLLAVGHKWKQPCEVHPELVEDCRSAQVVADMAIPVADPATTLNCTFSSNVDAPFVEYLGDCPDAAATKHGIRPSLVKAMIKFETQPGTSRNPKGVGLMQLPRRSCPGKDLEDARTNLDCYVGMFSNILHQHNGNERVALTAYVLGAGAFQRAQKSGKPLDPRAIAYAEQVLALADNKPKQTSQSGLHLLVISSHRDWNDQATAYCHAREAVGSADEARKLARVPGESTHQSGFGVDVTLVNAKGKRLDMPPFGNHKHPPATKAQRANVLVLQKAMKAAGFTATNQRDWWHFELKTAKPARKAGAPAQFDCDAWREGKLTAPPEPTDLVTGQINQLSKKVRLTQQALNALQAAERHLSSGQ